MRGATHAQEGEPLQEGVSIHAPVRGATRHLYLIFESMVSFNPRAREGRDILAVAILAILVQVFQSTRP